MRLCKEEFVDMELRVEGFECCIFEGVMDYFCVFFMLKLVKGGDVMNCKWVKKLINFDVEVMRFILV